MTDFVLQLDRPKQARLDRRRRQQQLVELARHLPDRQRMLIVAVFDDGHTFQDLAALLDASPRQLAREVASLVRRLRSPMFRFVVQRAHALPPDLANVAWLHHVHGHSLRTIARLTDQPLHRVRLANHALHALARVLN